MRKLICICVLALGFFDVTTAEQETSPQVAANEKSVLNEAVSCIKRLPRLEREALIAEDHDLLWREDGNCPYSTRIRNFSEKKVSISPGAKFVGSDGKVYAYWSVVKKMQKNSKHKNLWNTAKNNMRYVGRKSIMHELSDITEKMEVQLGLYSVRMLPQVNRDAWLAEMFELLYMPDGSNAISDVVKEKTVRNKKVPYKRVQRGAKFVGTDDKEYDFYELADYRYKHRKDKTRALMGLWDDASLIISKHGKKVFFKEFKSTIKTLRKNSKRVDFSSSR